MKGTDQEERKRIISRGESEKGLESWKGGGREWKYGKRIGRGISKCYKLNIDFWSTVILDNFKYSLNTACYS